MFIDLIAKRRSVAVAIAAALSLPAMLPVPAFAQYWGYSPYNGSANWLWMAQGLMYPLTRFSGYSTPYYLATPLLWNASYAVNQAVTNKNRRFYAGPYASDAGPTSEDPRQRTRAIVEDGSAPTDQVVHATRLGGEQQSSAGQAPPPVAPQRGFRRQRRPAPQPAAAPASANEPLAAGFIDLVNSKYRGDISKALFDPSTRQFAQAIGLIDDGAVFDADLSPAKVETIRAILGDTREDAVVRVNAVHMLLKH